MDDFQNVMGTSIPKDPYLLNFHEDLISSYIII